MKQLMCLVMGAGLAVTAYGQGLVSMNSAQTGGYVRFSNAWASAVGINTGWVSNRLGAVQGSLGYVNAALYWADPATPTTWHLVSPLATFGGGLTAGLVTTSSGGGSRTVMDGGTARTIPTLFQLRAWTGPYASWEDALASSDPNVNVSNINPSDPHHAPIVTATPSTASGLPATIIAWGGSSTSPIVVEMEMNVPEPSTLALVGLGLMGLIFTRRRK